MTTGRPATLDVVHVIDSLVAGGAERSLGQLAPELAGLGVRLHVVYLHDRPGIQDELSEAGARLTCIAGPGGRAGWLRRLHRLLGDDRPDIVHTTLFEADVTGRLAAGLRRTPVVSSMVNETYGTASVSGRVVSPARLRAAQAVDLLTLRLTRRVHAVSQVVADAVVRDLRYPADRIDVIHRGRSPAQLGERTPARRRAVRSGLGLRDDRPVVLAVARTEPQKNLDAVIRALPELSRTRPDLQLIVAGRPGRAQPGLDELVATLGVGDRVRFLGHRDDVADLQVAADVFVLPSLWEGFPGSLVEAMALRTPIVASDIPQVREALGGEGGLLVPADDSAGFARAIGEVLDTPSRAAVETLHRRFHDQLTVAATARQMRDFYDRSTQSPPPDRRS